MEIKESNPKDTIPGVKFPEKSAAIKQPEPSKESKELQEHKAIVPFVTKEVLAETKKAILEAVREKFATVQKEIKKEIKTNIDEVLKINITEIDKLKKEMNDERKNILLDLGFEKGKMAMMALAEEKLAEENDIKRADLAVKSELMPSWWIATIMAIEDIERQ